MTTNLDLFITFFKIGLFTFGGGYAMLPLIKSEAADKKHWISPDEMPEILALSESTPGPIAVNSATFVGYRAAGVFGSACATLGVVLPSFIIIALLGGILDKISDYEAVRYAFFGIRAGVLALIVKALVDMYKKCREGSPALLFKRSDATKSSSNKLKIAFAHALMLVAFVLVFVVKLTSPAVLLLCAGLGILVYFAQGAAQK